MKNKGQAFLITAVILIITLVLLKLSVNIPDLLEGEKEIVVSSKPLTLTFPVPNGGLKFHSLDLKRERIKNSTRNVFPVSFFP